MSNEMCISSLGFDILTDFKNVIAHCLSLSLVLDESSNIRDKTQLAIFVCSVTKDVGVKE